MSQITVKNASGKDTGKVDLDDNTFGIEPNVSVMHQVVTAQLAARRAGTQSTKTRSEVRGGGAKPFRQKGTGNARQGSIRAPHYSGGGVALGPKPRKYDQKTPKKMIGLALRSALSDRANEGKIIVVDSWGWDAPSTKAAKAALADLGITGKALVVVDRDDAAAALSFRNLIEVQLITPGELNAYDVLCNEYIIFTQGTLPAGASEPKGKAPKATQSKAKATKAPKAKESPTKESSAKEPKAAKADAADSAAPAIQSFADVDASGTPASTIHPHGTGSHAALADNAQPAGFPIKGNADSMLYHVPGSSFYGRTVAEVWFDGEASAQAAGFSRPDSQADADAPTADEIAEASADAVPVQPHGAGSYVALAGDVEPDGYPIKGNADSMLYHTTESSFYGRTVAEVWFADEAAAEAAGFSKPASQQAAEESDEG